MPISLDSLNDRQRLAVTYGQGPLLVLAGAGSGKTKTMAYRIAYLIAQEKALGRNILGLSFTNKAAKELKERVMLLLIQHGKKAESKGLVVSTFHSLCARLLRKHASSLGFQEHFSILDESDQKDILKEVLKNIRVDDRRFDLDILLFEMGRAKNQFLKGAEAEAFFLESKHLAPDYREVVASAWVRYQEQLKLLNAMDFDDLLYYTVLLFQENPSLREGYSQFFRYLLVDEYQDTNPAQFEILRALTSSHQNLCVVGDDDQSIYGWRGADAAHILNFKGHYPTAEVVTLNQNYRSTSRILEAANGVISKNRQRYPKQLWSALGEGEPIQEVLLENDRAEAEFVSDEILKQFQEGKRWNDFAVLYRSHPQSRVFEEAFRMRKIPYKIVGGYSFLDRKEVKNLLSYWKLILNPKEDPAFRRVIQWPSRGIGKASLDVLSEKALQAQSSLMDTIDSRLDLSSQKALKNLLEFRAHILDLRLELERLPAPWHGEKMSSWAKKTVEVFEFQSTLEKEEDSIQSLRQWENIQAVIHSFGQFISSDVNSGIQFLQEYLQRMMLDRAEEDSKDPQEEKEKNQVTLLTLHGAKGLEFPVVFLVGMEEGSLPHQRVLDESADLSEERRLCYVGMTRAQKNLFLTRSKKRSRYGKIIDRIPSRFLEDIPLDLRIKSDQSLEPEFSSKEQRQIHEQKVSSFLDQIRSNLMKGKPLK